MNITLPSVDLNVTIPGTSGCGPGATIVYSQPPDWIVVYMSLMTFAVVVYLTICYKLHTYDRMNRDTFRNRMRDGIFVLIISTAWLFERALYTLIWG